MRPCDYQFIDIIFITTFIMNVEQKGIESGVLHMDEIIRKAAIELRHELHMYPELSGEEVRTKNTLMGFLSEKTKLEIVDCGAWFYAKYNAKTKAKPSIAFRADMDAIMVDEDDSLPYASKHRGTAHKCGHDGHCSALCAFAMELNQMGADRDVYLIFQHAEEIGTGALECCHIVEDEDIAEIYGIHNLPGKSFGSICTRAGTINLASVGVEYTFVGAPTHASTPELGKNPAKVISRMVLAIDEITQNIQPKGLLLATVIQIDLGERSFGVSASRGKLLLTVRGEHGEEMKQLLDELRSKGDELCQDAGITMTIDYYDDFTDTVNHVESVEKVRNICSENGIEFEELENPIRTSEDFGHFIKKRKGALLWIGAGEEWTPLHNKDYDYNDKLIEKTAEIIWHLIKY